MADEDEALVVDVAVAKIKTLKLFVVINKPIQRDTILQIQLILCQSQKLKLGLFQKKVQECLKIIVVVVGDVHIIQHQIFKLTTFLR